MKNFALYFLMLTVFMAACNNDDNDSDNDSCDITDVASVLVGEWDEFLLGSSGEDVTFNSDLTGSCSDESSFVTEFNGDVSKTFTWEVIDSSNVVVLDYPNGIGLEYNIQSVTCNNIGLELFGFTVELERK